MQVVAEVRFLGHVVAVNDVRHDSQNVEKFSVIRNTSQKYVRAFNNVTMRSWRYITTPLKSPNLSRTFGKMSVEVKSVTYEEEM